MAFIWSNNRKQHKKLISSTIDTVPATQNKIESIKITVRNNTTIFDNEVVWQVLNHVVGSLGLKRYREIDIIITNHGFSANKKFAAVCYPYGVGKEVYPSAPKRPLIIVRITANKNAFPDLRDNSTMMGAKNSDGYIRYLQLDITECLIGTLAHEFRQTRNQFLLSLAVFHLDRYWTSIKLHPMSICMCILSVFTVYKYRIIKPVRLHFSCIWSWNIRAHIVIIGQH
jgi:hypothetical protein